MDINLVTNAWGQRGDSVSIIRKWIFIPHTNVIIDCVRFFEGFFGGDAITRSEMIGCLKSAPMIRPSSQYSSAIQSEFHFIFKLKFQNSHIIDPSARFVISHIAVKLASIRDWGNCLLFAVFKREHIPNTRVMLVSKMCGGCCCCAPFSQPKDIQFYNIILCTLMINPFDIVVCN